MATKYHHLLRKIYHIALNILNTFIFTNFEAPLLSLSAFGPFYFYINYINCHCHVLSSSVFVPSTILTYVFTVFHFSRHCSIWPIAYHLFWNAFVLQLLASNSFLNLHHLWYWNYECSISSHGTRQSWHSGLFNRLNVWRYSGKHPCSVSICVKLKLTHSKFDIFNKSCPLTVNSLFLPITY